MLIIKVYKSGAEKLREVVHISDADGLALCKRVSETDEGHKAIPDMPSERTFRYHIICTNCLRKESPRPSPKAAAQIKREEDAKKLEKWKADVLMSKSTRAE